MSDTVGKVDWQPGYDPRKVPGRMDELESAVKQLSREVMTLWATCFALALVLLLGAWRSWRAGVSDVG